MSGEQPQAVVWIASYPKSGNTWLQTVVRFAGRSFGFPRADLDVYQIVAQGRRPEAVGGVRSQISDRPTTVLKTHDRFVADRDPHAELGMATVGFVYVLRNPFDMLLSYINFTRQQYANRSDSARYRQEVFTDLLGYDEPFTPEAWRDMTLERIPRRHLDHALQRFTELGASIPGVARMAKSTWIEHGLSWKAAARRLPAVFLRYEDLVSAPEAFLPLQRLFQFTDAQIIDAVNEVNAMQRAKQNKHIFYNKMTSYYFKDYFSRDLVERFIDRYEGPLAELGYADLRDHVC